MLKGLIRRKNLSYNMIKILVFIILFFFAGLKMNLGAQPNESFRHSRLEIQSGDVMHAFTVEIAETSQQRSLGLQYRKSMAPDHGMLFNFRKPFTVSM